MLERFSGTGWTGLFSTASISSAKQKAMASPTWLERTAYLLAALLLLLAFSLSASASELENRARQYKPYLQQQARIVWGFDAPVMLFAAQIHQESAWRPDARSKDACGLTQFTPDTMEWIAEQYRVEVGKGE